MLAMAGRKAASEAGAPKQTIGECEKEYRGGSIFGFA